MTPTPQENLPQLGGKIHTILNETLYRKLSLKEYKKVITLISKVFDEAARHNKP